MKQFPDAPTLVMAWNRGVPFYYMQPLYTTPPFLVLFPIVFVVVVESIKICQCSACLRYFRRFLSDIGIVHFDIRTTENHRPCLVLQESACCVKIHTRRNL